MRQMLTPHPDFQGGAATAVAAEAKRTAPGVLALRYVVRAAAGGLVLPPPSPSVRTDELWRHTCLEAFVRPADGLAYWEINLSPSTQWAAYRFDGYRLGMTGADIPDPEIAMTSTVGGFELTARVSLPLPGAWRLGLAAVLEAADGGRSYWALAHPAGQPDFHHADCFAAELPAPPRS